MVLQELVVDGVWRARKVYCQCHCFFWLLDFALVPVRVDGDEVWVWVAVGFAVWKFGELFHVLTDSVKCHGMPIFVSWQAHVIKCRYGVWRNFWRSNGEAWSDLYDVVDIIRVVLVHDAWYFSDALSVYNAWWRNVLCHAELQGGLAVWGRWWMMFVVVTIVGLVLVWPVLWLMGTVSAVRW